MSDESNVQQLISELRSQDSDPQIRIRAIRALGDLHAVEPLIENLDEDTEPEIIEALFETLVSLGDHRAIEPLINQLHRVDFKQAYSLFTFGDAILTPLINALQHGKADIRWQAAYLLGNKKDDRAVKPLIECLNDTSDRVRVQAIYSLVWIGANDAIPALEPLLEDDAVRVRNAASEAIGKLKNTET